jgi:hypothetical protein
MPLRFILDAKNRIEDCQVVISKRGIGYMGYNIGLAGYGYWGLIFLVTLRLIKHVNHRLFVMCDWKN